MSTSRPPPKSASKGPPRKRPRSVTTTRPASPRAKHSAGGRKLRLPLHGPQRWLALILAWALFLSTLGAASIAGALLYYSRGLPDAEALRNYTPAQTTRVLDRHGELIGEVFTERRTVVPMERIPRVLVLSVLAAEDADFYHHSGMDLPGMMRILVKAVVRGRATQGGSTITQQVVKNLLLSPERTLERKLKELILARRIERELTKDEILFLYLNHINFGHGRYGVQEAARYYFGKDVENLTLAEASLIAGIPQSPTYLSPRSHPEAAKKRQAFVLDQLEQKRELYWADLPLSEIERARAALPKLAAVPDIGERAPEMAALGRQALIDTVGEEAAALGGYTVITTVDLALEKHARKALQDGLSEIDARHGHLTPLTGPLIGDKQLSKLRARTKVDATGSDALRVGGHYDAVVLGHDDASTLALSIDGIRAIAHVSTFARFNPKGLDAKALAKPGVKLRVTVRRLESGQPVETEPALGPEGAVILVDPRSREVLALVGGYAATNGFNRAVQARRQPGSTFKPIVYALGIKSRRFTPATQVIDAPGVFDRYQPGNYETWSYAGPVRLRHALAQSINLVAIRVIDELKPEAVVSFAKELGITTDLEPSLPLALGASEVQLSELTNAYATLAAGGRFRQLRFVQKIVAPDGRELRFKGVDAPRDVLTPAEAYVTTSLLTSVIEEGTGARAKALKRPAAGKTGTSNQARDAWFVGYTADLVAGVWVGYDDHRPLGRKESGGKSALPIWLELMQIAHEGKPALPFGTPSGVVTARIDPTSGLLAYEGQADAIDEVFLEDTVPTAVARPPDVADPTTFMMEQLGSMLTE